MTPKIRLWTRTRISYLEIIFYIIIGLRKIGSWVTGSNNIEPLSAHISLSYYLVCSTPVTTRMGCRPGSTLRTGSRPPSLLASVPNLCLHIFQYTILLGIIKCTQYIVRNLIVHLHRRYRPSQASLSQNHNSLYPIDIILMSSLLRSPNSVTFCNCVIGFIGNCSILVFHGQQSIYVALHLKVSLDWFVTKCAITYHVMQILMDECNSGY